MSQRGPGTRAVHGDHGPRSGPLTPPIAQTSTFAFSSSAEMRRYLDGDPALYLYTRYANPTLDELERALAALEGAEAGLALASGMAAMSTAVLSFVRAGLTDAALRTAGIDPGMVRLSIGVEDEADLAADIEQALAG